MEPAFDPAAHACEMWIAGDANFIEMAAKIHTVTKLSCIKRGRVVVVILEDGHDRQEAFTQMAYRYDHRVSYVVIVCPCLDERQGGIKTWGFNPYKMRTIADASHHTAN